MEYILFIRIEFMLQLKLDTILWCECKHCRNGSIFFSSDLSARITMTMATTAIEEKNSPLKECAVNII